MINLTLEVIILKSGSELSESIKLAITHSKNCVKDELYGGAYISPSKITSSARNEYYQASIFRLFDGHLDHSLPPSYDEEWIKNIYLCALKTPPADLAKRVTPPSAHDWLNNSSLMRLSQDALLILHFLWHVGAVLLPMTLKKPTVKDPTTGSNFKELAAPTYPEVLALVSLPNVSHFQYTGIPDIRTVMQASAIDNFGWYAWRMVRASDWHKIEDIDPADVAECANALLAARKKEIDWITYPISPKAFFAYVQKLYPTRCQREDPQHAIKNNVQASKSSITRGEFHISDEHLECVSTWLRYQDKFIEHLKSRGLKSYESYRKSLAILNTYLFSTLLSAGVQPPLPNQFNRSHVESDKFDGLLKSIKSGRSSATVQNHLYQLDTFFNYMAAHASSDRNLAGFANPITDIDFPVVRRRSGTNKVAFESEHFPYLLHYCYAIESFATYISEKVHFEQINLYADEFRSDIASKNWNDAQKVIQTEKFGYIPVVFYKNPFFDPKKPISNSNKRMKCEPLHLLSRSVIPIIEHSVMNNERWVFYPQLNYIRHNIVALETGIRSIHIRWLDRRSYDQNIDRSRRLAQICKLHINTDKVNGAWEASVAKDVIELLDRQHTMTEWFNDPLMSEETWYDYHEDSLFGKIVTLFPNWMKQGTLHPESYMKYFKRLIYSFDLFCRYQLQIETTNQMPEALLYLDSISDPTDFLTAVKLEGEACKLIEHTPHSCRVSVVSEHIRVLPPHIIGTHITGHATEAHVIYYAKLDPAYLKTITEYQKKGIEEGWNFDISAISCIKAEEVTSKLQQAFRRNKEQALVDFGAISFDRENKDDVLSGVRTAKQRPLESLVFMPTHICPVGNQCTADVIRDLGAVPGSIMPCGSCYLSIKTVDHLPRIHGHIRVLTDECSELESYIAEARKNGASSDSLVHKANHRKFLASETISWSVTAHCLEQMLSDIKTRSSFLVEKPEIVSEHLERLELKEHTLSNLIARTSEAKSHAEFFTPQLANQVKVARNKLLAFTGDFNRMLQEAPTGFTLIDEFRGLIRSTCEVLGLSLHDLSDAMSKPMALDRPNSILKLISNSGSAPA
ncbi:hypothetical protein [Pseudomonas denitrificans (nom. rej.)]|uniref:Uncharacterized protein n=1 Tax=Pseudomonas denitrificans TaxID=43306 RepID=A0A9X7N4N3_PSEDE|nr:hypothetical protein [Pseudomonas denitrificans (nom. rej.)]QEY75062.1 hypothetical protein F1C79_27465 [Pseudomonas denitrificans (nom. rej.)]